MSIPSQAEAKAASLAAEIAPIEAALKAYLEHPQQVAYLESTVANKIIIRTFKDVELSAPGIAALKASITAAGWTTPVVENQLTPAEVGLGINRGQHKKELFVSFKPGAATPPEGGGA